MISGLEESLNREKLSCPVCGSVKVEKIKSKYNSHILCHNENCNVILHNV